MKFDLFSLMQKRDDSWTGEKVFGRLLEQIRLGERIGLETSWFAEHHFNNYSLCPSPLVLAAWCAGKTEKIRLGTAVLVAPLYEPVRVLQEIAMVDTLSGGRLVVGIGSGYQDYEFERFRVKLPDAVDRTLEMLDIIEMGLTQDQFSYDGKFYKLPPTQIAVKPVQKPMPEIWVAGLMSVPKVQKRVAESGYVPFLTPAWNPTTILLPARKAYDEIYRSIGLDPAQQPLSLMRFTHITKSKTEAREAAERARYSSRLSLALRLNYAKINGIYVEEAPAKAEIPIEEMERNYLVGDAETVIERIIKDWEIMRHSHVAFNVQLGGVPHERTMRTLEEIGSTVIPGVRKELARRGVTKTPDIRQQPLMAVRKQAAE